MPLQNPSASTERLFSESKTTLLEHDPASRSSGMALTSAVSIVAPTSTVALLLRRSISAAKDFDARLNAVQRVDGPDAVDQRSWLVCCCNKVEGFAGGFLCAMILDEGRAKTTFYVVSQKSRWRHLQKVAQCIRSAFHSLGLLVPIGSLPCKPP